MAGLIGLGSALNKQAVGSWEGAAGLESARNREEQMAKDAAKQAGLSTAISGATTGAMIGGPYGAAIGGALGWLGSRLL